MHRTISLCAGVDPGGSDRSLSILLAEPDTNPNAIIDPNALADRHRHANSTTAPDPVALAELKGIQRLVS